MTSSRLNEKAGDVFLIFLSATKRESQHLLAEDIEKIGERVDIRALAPHPANRIRDSCGSGPRSMSGRRSCYKTPSFGESVW